MSFPKYETAQEIRWTYERDSYLCDPHTAVALHVYEQYTQQTGDSAPVLIASTASPFKFACTKGWPPDRYSRRSRLEEIRISMEGEVVI
mgnify:CR=1 FL=1